MATVLDSVVLEQCFSNLTVVKNHLITMQILNGKVRVGPRFCISNRLPGLLMLLLTVHPLGSEGL